jgi:N-acetylglucosamine kinase-like BadF-type ATPase
MILIAESGSTKCDCILLNARGEEVTRGSSMGFNPFFHGSELINRKLSEMPGVQQWAPQVSKVFFYGAGCSSPQRNAIVERGLSKVFPTASIKVGHDLEASAYATYEGQPLISGILGTGSNSVFFNGQSLREEVPALGYLLGDEGSASFIGKGLITAFLYHRLPTDLRLDFEQMYQTHKEEIFDHVYNQPHANVYLAGFSKFAGKHSKHPFIQALVRDGFNRFVDIHVACYPESREVPVSFVGSVAYHFRDVLKEVVESQGIAFGKTVSRPLDELVQYHVKYLHVLEESPI